MYTQCPDCEIAFKVTADVLKQAAGKVRCGGCGNAFNALAYLSEQMPKQPVAQKASAAVPELTPEIIETDDGRPHAISAEQSAALLKTLDELAGSNIRIEDTGVEWRVLDEDEAAAPAADDDDADLSFSPDFGVKNVDEFLDDAETPIDEFLTATPEVVESPEIFEAEANGPAKTRVDELRFDDNTPLPDDFDLDDESSYTPQPDPEQSRDDEVAEPDVFDEEPQPEIALSDPEEWTDILGEFEDLVQDIVAPVEEVTPEIASPEEEDIEPDAEPDVELTTEEPLDMDTQFALQAEAMGIDLSGINEIDIDDDVSVEALQEEIEAELEDELEEDIEAELEDESEEEPEAEFADELEDDLEAELEEDIEAALEGELEDDLEAEFDVELDEDLEAEPEDDFEEELEAELEDELSDLEEELPDDDLFAADAEQLDLIEEPIIESHTIENELAGDESDEEPDEVEEDSDEHYIPPMTEEEHTVNMQIDQDLMALAIEDDDGFASTIVIPEKDAEKKALDEAKEPTDDDSDEDDLDINSGFETIIMEGEFVRSAMDSKKLAADVAAAAELASLARAKEAEEAARSGGARYGIIGGIVVLVLLMAIQVIHQSREALATIPAFSSTVGQFYRAIGQPVQPAWDITGWRFEATKGSAEGEDEELTIYSRLGNKSDGPLPYPLIGISLTDRFEETIGSRVLDPAEYLTSDLDPRKLVEPGNTFNAVITIKSSSEDATGFKLNVCYRLSDGQLRCAIEDFK